VGNVSYNTSLTRVPSMGTMNLATLEQKAKESRGSHNNSKILMKTNSLVVSTTNSNRGNITNRSRVGHREDRSNTRDPLISVLNEKHVVEAIGPQRLKQQ